MALSPSFTMLIKFGILLVYLNCVKTTQEYENGHIVDRDRDYTRYSLWPSAHNAAKLWRNRREVQKAAEGIGPSEGGDTVDAKPPLTIPMLPATDTHAPSNASTAATESKDQNNTKTADIQTQKDKIPQVTANTTETTLAPVINTNATKTNATVTDKSTTTDIDLSNPGVLKRGFIVFGGFALMAVAYYIFYRRKSKKNELTNSHNTIDANQFRYGVLQSEDHRDNIEQSRIPLTMESDEDEEEDLEIFDLEQKKKSLSYVNLQMNDEHIVLSSSENKAEERDNLLLDIGDGTSETLINWSSNGSKSIL